MKQILGETKVGKGTYIGHYTVLGAPLPETIRGEKKNEGCVIGEDCIIRQYNVIMETARLGNRVHTGPFVEIRERSVIGDDTRIHVGTEVMHDVKIGSRVRIAEHAMIGEYAEVGDDTFIGMHTAFAPDKKMINQCGKVWIGRGVRLGGQVMVVGGVRVGNGVIVGGNSVVTKDILPFTMAYGTPAKTVRLLSEQEVKEYNDVLERKWGKQKVSLLDLYHLLRTES